MTSLTTQSASHRQARIERICTVFSGSPRLRAVAVRQVQTWLDSQFSALNLTADAVALGTPVGVGAQGPGPYLDHTYARLPDVLLERSISGEPVRYAEGYHVVAVRVRESYIPGGPGLEDVERMINQRGPYFLLVWQGFWQAWWQQVVEGAMTRLAYLADALFERLYDSPKPAGITDQQFEAMFPRYVLRTAQALRTRGVPGAQLHIQTLHVRRQAAPVSEPASMLPVLLLKHQLLGAETATLLMFSPAMGVSTLSRPEDAFGLSPNALHLQDAAEVYEWGVLEPLDDPFALLAVACALGQRREIEAIKPGTVTTATQLQALVDHIVDPRRWFALPLTPMQQRLQEALPLWLAHAADEDLIAYVRNLAALAVAQHEAVGRDYLEGVAPIKTFAANALQACLDGEPSAGGVQVADITLSFFQVVGAGMPGGFVVGGVEPQTVSLTELALENLVGFAHAPRAIRVKDQPAPAALTYTLLKGCVARADIGQHYPALLKRTFITDTVEAARREQLFVAQLRAQLPLLALEMKVKGMQGLTANGYRWLEAAVQTSGPGREVDGKPAALWPLAFNARPGDSADTVVNMYIIGPADGAGGPHLLYRPLLQPALHEYESLEALFAAIKVAGPLQDTVLAWMAPARRYVYANGGFAEPHIARVFQGDEFTPPSRPAPAQLSKHIVVGDPLHAVFRGTVMALVTLADAQSVSNAEARWATLKAGGWLLFNEVLPMLSGPLGLAGWLVQGMASLQQDTVAMTEGDPAARRQATADLLINLLLVLAHQLPSGVEPQRQVPQPSPLERSAPLIPHNVVPATRVIENTRPSGWFNGSDVLSPAMKARLEGMSLRPEAVKGTLEIRGALKGLFRDGAHWQAQVRGRRYRVQVRQGSVRVLSADGDTQGPWLKRLADDNWDIDLQLRLAGGNADSAIAERQQTQADSAVSLEAELARLRGQIEITDKAIHVAHGLLDNPRASEAQRTAVHGRFVQELKNKLNSVLLEVQVLKQLRAKGPRRGYEAELCSTLENLILTEQMLTVQMRAQTSRVNSALKPIFERVEAIADDALMTQEERQDHDAIVEGLGQLAEINDDAIRWRAMENRHLQELREVPRLGRDLAEALTQAAGTLPSVLELQALQVTNFWALALESTHTPADEVFLQDVNTMVERARWASRSHASLESLAVASSAERIELLERINQVYGETSDSLAFWQEMQPEYFNRAYVEKLRQLLHRLHYDAELQLTDLLSALPAPTFPVVSVRGRARQKIIRTRNNDLWVATINEASVDALEVVAELKDDNQKVIASFTQADDGVWEEVKAPVARVATRPGLNRLLEQGQKLLGQVDVSISKVLGQAATSNEPQSLQDILDHQATTLRDCAAAITQRLLQEDQARLAATQRARAQTRAHELTAAASRLVEQGLQARVNAVKARPPTAAGVEFLRSQEEVRIYRMEDRVPLKGKRNDFLQVYGVFDVHDHQALCYAHFHYESAAAFNDHFTAAHLKTPEQHRLGKQAQAQAQAHAFALIQAGQSGRAQPTLAIYRSEINLGTARRLFFDAPLWTGRW